MLFYAMEYKDLEFKIPIETDDYEECSIFVTQAINKIILELSKMKKIKLLSTQT